MNIFADYHTHTIYSHGKGTIRENVDAAIKKGLREIVISDHGPGHVTYGVTRKNLRRMREEVDSLKKEYKEISILLGVEANLISCNGDIDVTSDDIRLLDKLLVGFHNGAMPRTLKDGYNLYLRNYASRLISPLQATCRDINTSAMIKAINKYNIDIITHPGAKIDINTKELAKAAAARGTALEINSSHGQMTAEYVKIAMNEKVYFVIDSDAHTPGNVGNFTNGIRIAQEAGLPAERILNASR